jgi:hypothetical protein
MAWFRHKYTAFSGSVAQARNRNDTPKPVTASENLEAPMSKAQFEEKDKLIRKHFMDALASSGADPKSEGYRLVVEAFNILMPKWPAPPNANESHENDR